MYKYWFSYKDYVTKYLEKYSSQGAKSALWVGDSIDYLYLQTGGRGDSRNIAH